MHPNKVNESSKNRWDFKTKIWRIYFKNITLAQHQLNNYFYRAWDDETVFQEARRINIAQYQHISYYEWLPIFLGRENMLKNRLIYQSKGNFVNDYNFNIDPSVLNAHATAAFRYFHSQIEGRLEYD